MQKVFFFIILITIVLFSLGCQEDTSYEKGWKDYDVSEPNANKQYSIDGSTCGPANNCNAVYYSGTAGNGVAVDDGGHKWKIYRALGDSSYTIVYDGTKQSTTAAISVSYNSTDKVYEITVTDNGGAANVNNGDTVSAQGY